MASLADHLVQIDSDGGMDHRSCGTFDERCIAH